MIAYIDSSVLLRIAFHQPGNLALNKFSEFYSSELLYIECLRTAHNSRLRGRFDDEQLAETTQQLLELLRQISFIPLAPRILQRAGMALSTVLGTLDAIHYSSLIEFAQTMKDKPVLLTHDVQLARAAMVAGFEVLGV